MRLYANSTRKMEIPHPVHLKIQAWCLLPIQIDNIMALLYVHFLVRHVFIFIIV